MYIAVSAIIYSHQTLDTLMLLCTEVINKFISAIMITGFIFSSVFRFLVDLNDHDRLPTFENEF